MSRLSDLSIAVTGALAEWRGLSWDALHFSRASTASMILLAVSAIAILMVLVRRVWPAGVSRSHIVVPALLANVPHSRLSLLRHLPFFIVLAGVPLFALALADPRTTFMRQEVSYPGRRIALVVDGSTSMTMKFQSTQLHTAGAPAFFTAVASAEHFLRMRMGGPYRDLLALVEFGNEAHVVTPFTTDYENVLLSLKLVGDPKEWGRFDDWGTTILQGLEVGLNLFKTFDFLNASGNLMVIFTDGRDDQLALRGRKLDDLLAEARRYQIPVYMIRIAFNLEQGKVPQDLLWKAAVERTGGRFYAAPDEDAILRAERDIDRLSAGHISLQEYSSERPRFEGFGLMAVGLWAVAAALKLGSRVFLTFP
jgi:von Willebrand factor type A domain